MIRERLAKYDRNGDPLTNLDVLDDWELAADIGWLLPSRPVVVADPGLVAEVARLQVTVR